MIKSKFSSVVFKPLNTVLFWSPSQNAYENTSVWFNNQIAERGKIFYDVKFSDEMIEQNPELFEVKYAYITVPGRKFTNRKFYWVKTGELCEYEPAQYSSSSDRFQLIGNPNNYRVDEFYEIRNEVR